MFLSSSSSKILKFQQDHRLTFETSQKLEPSQQAIKLDLLVNLVEQIRILFGKQFRTAVRTMRMPRNQTQRERSNALLETEESHAV